MTYARNSDNKYGFISLSLRHLHLLFKQRMLLEKKSGFCSQHDKRFMQLKQRDILGNYAEKKWGHCSHRSTHKFAFVRKVTGRVAQMRDRTDTSNGRILWQWSSSEYAVSPEIELRMTENPCCSTDFSAVVKKFP